MTVRFVVVVAVVVALLSGLAAVGGHYNFDDEVDDQFALDVVGGAKGHSLKGSGTSAPEPADFTDIPDGSGNEPETLVVSTPTSRDLGLSTSGTPPTTPSISTSPSSTSLPGTADQTTTSNATTTTADLPDEPSTSTTTTGEGRRGDCLVETLEPSDGFASFYGQGCDLGGLRILSSGAVDPSAMVAAGRLTWAILDHDPSIRKSVLSVDADIGIIGVNESLLDLPHYDGLASAYPHLAGRYQELRGIAATPRWPMLAIGEENLLCMSTDLYPNQDTLLHELAHLVHRYGYRLVEPGFDEELSDAYERALESGIWDNTYAATSPPEYWAELVRTYFSRIITAEPADGVYGPIGDKAQLQSVDPLGFALVNDRLGGLELPSHCYGL